jgi:hypothetical protein
MLARSTTRMLLAGLLLTTCVAFGAAQDYANSAAPPRIEFLPVAAQAPATAPQAAPPAPKAPDGKTPDAVGPKAPEAKTEPAPETPNFQPITSAALGDSQVALSAPQIMGDFGGYTVRRTVLVPATVFTTVTKFQTVTIIPGGEGTPVTTVTSSSTTTPSRIFVPVTVQVPVLSRDGSGFKIGDNDSPIPTDRVFFTYNYFDGLRGTPGSFPGQSSSSTVVGPTNFNVTFPDFNFVFTTNSNTTTSTLAPGSAIAQANLNREIFGFEKTFFDGYASFEVRVPIFQAANESIAAGGFAGSDFGDVTTVFKFALIKQSDAVFSVGLATTFPTGPAILSDTGSFRDVLFQPFFGFYRSYGDFFVEGITSVVLATSAQDPTLLFNDYAFGYTVYRGTDPRYPTSISPALEVHVSTPLGNHDESSSVFVSNVVSLTGGLHFGFGPRSTMSFGCNVPLTGPRPYNAEALVQFNYRF